VTEVIQHHAKQLVSILTKELELERSELKEKLHQRTLERIFIEERIYKKIEDMKTAETVIAAVIAGFKPFAAEVGSRGVSDEDVDRLLKIPIRRISLYDINKARAEMKEIEARIKEIGKYLKDIVAYAAAFLDGVIAKIKANEELGGGKRKTKEGRFDKVDVKEVVKKDLQLRYDAATGYLGTSIAGGEVVADVSTFDRVLALRRNGTFTVMDLPEKTFVDKGAWYVGVADKDALAKIVFTVIYKEEGTGYPCIKRCQIEGWIMNKEYSIAPDGAEIIHIDTRDKFTINVSYQPKPRVRVLKETFKAQDYLVKGLKAGGVRLAPREAAKFEIK